MESGMGIAERCGKAGAFPAADILLYSGVECYMADDENKDYEIARQDLEKAIDDLRSLSGKAPIYDAAANETGVVSPEPPLCSFCGKGHNQVKCMVQGNNAYICNQCLTLGYEIVNAGQ